MWEPISDAGKARKRSLCHEVIASSCMISVAESGPFENLINVPKRKPPQLSEHFLKPLKGKVDITFLLFVPKSN